MLSAGAAASLAGAAFGASGSGSSALVGGSSAAGFSALSAGAAASSAAGASVPAAEANSSAFTVSAGNPRLFRASTASAALKAPASTETTAVLVSESISTFATPGSFCNAPLTVARQPPQVMPGQ